MTAEEMFENLGYKKIQDDKNIVDYVSYFGEQIYDRIYFDKDYHEINFGGVRRYWWTVNFDLAKAIMKQCEELWGGLDETE